MLTDQRKPGIAKRGATAHKPFDTSIK
jgi:hypothetical protein